MKSILYILLFTVSLSLKAQIAPFTNHDWTIEKIVTSNNTTIMADPLPDGTYDQLVVYFNDFDNLYSYLISQCQGAFDFDDNNQSFEILYYGCVISLNHTNIADHFLNIFIVQEGGETQAPEGTVYGPFSYDFTYSGDLVYLHITNLAGSVATFYASNLSQEEFLRQQVNAYPNPVNDILYLESSGIALENLYIYDLRGRLVEKYNEVNNQINVSHLQQGVFILEIETSIGVLRKKLIKR